IVAADEFLDDVEGLQWMIETVDIDRVAKGVAALVALFEQRIFVGLHIVVTAQAGVGADPDMIDTDQLRDIVDMAGPIAPARRVIRNDPVIPSSTSDNLICRLL